MITKIYLEWFPCEKYITGMPLGLFSQKMKLRARFPISEGERPGKRPEENRATTKPDERSQNKLSERRGDRWHLIRNRCLNFPCVRHTTNDHKEVGLPVLQDSALPPGAHNLIYLVRPDD